LLAVEKNLISEIEKTREEMMRQLAEQKAELARFGTQVRALKAEKTVLQNQVAALQRRIVNIDEEIGQE
jgi:septal ring factor EnvC (AmiA/AmiB activator)